jgi:hypothetical protein
MRSVTMPNWNAPSPGTRPIRAQTAQHLLGIADARCSGGRGAARGDVAMGVALEIGRHSGAGVGRNPESRLLQRKTGFRVRAGARPGMTNSAAKNCNDL